MKYVEEDKNWYLFCPDKCPNLVGKYGHEFEKEYHKYVELGQWNYVLPAREIWTNLLNIQGESGTPYLLSKENINKNQIMSILE